MDTNEGRGMPPLVLQGSGLLSKWGFWDGDLIDEWYYENTGDVPPAGVNDHEVLTKLVEAHLLPAVARAGHTFEVAHISTVHNPIRLEDLDGQRVDWYSHDKTPLDGIAVEVPAAAVFEALSNNPTEERGDER